jgi:hypothetical protein
MSNKIETIYGWWSDQQAKLGGYSVYTTPDGGTVKISVCTPTEQHNMMWEDIKFVGIVCEFLEHYDANGKLTSQSFLGRKMYGERLVNTCEPARAMEVIEFMSYKGLTTFSKGLA